MIRLVGFGIDIHILFRVLLRTLFGPEPEPPTDLKPVGFSDQGWIEHSLYSEVPLSSDKFDHSLQGTVTSGYCPLRVRCQSIMNGNGRDLVAST